MNRAHQTEGEFVRELGETDAASRPGAQESRCNDGRPSLDRQENLSQAGCALHENSRCMPGRRSAQDDFEGMTPPKPKKGRTVDPAENKTPESETQTEGSAATPAPAAGKPKAPAAPPEPPKSKAAIVSKWTAHRVEHSKQTNTEEVHLRLAGSRNGHAIDLSIENPNHFGQIKPGDKVQMTLTVA